MKIFTIPGRNYDSNIYVLRGKNPTIVDTGTGFFSAEICEIIKKMIQPTTITYIVLTHEHYDHVGGVKELIHFSEGNAKIIAHKNTGLKLKSGESSFAEALGGNMPKIKIDGELVGGEQLLFGDDLFDILYTPGHSKGSICLYEKKSKSLISGDTIFANGDYGRYDLSGGDFQELVSSIDHIASLDITNLYPGHGDVIETDGKAHVVKSCQNIHSI